MDVVQTIQERINQRRRQLLVHSFLYYRMDISHISDYQYDEFALELIRLQENYPEEAEQCIFPNEFRGFQMGHSFDLPIHHPHVEQMALKYLRSRGRYLKS